MNLILILIDYNLKSAVDKLYSFVSSHIFETKVAGKFAAVLVRSCSKVCHFS